MTFILKSERAAHQTPVTNQHNGVYVEFDECGWHRLVVNGKASSWTMYEHPCFFEGYSFLTEYWGYEKGQLFKVVECEPTEASYCVCHECGKPSGWNGKTFAPSVCQHLRKQWEKTNLMFKRMGYDSVPSVPFPVREER